MIRNPATPAATTTAQAGSFQAASATKHAAAMAGEGEERAGDGLCGAVAGKESLLADMSVFHHLRLQQWQDDMPAAEYK